MYEQARWHPYSYEGRRPSVPDQATLMADIEEMQRKRKYDEESQKNIKEQENILSERKAAEVAANPYDSPFIGRTMEYSNHHRFVDAGCTSCRTKERTVADLTSKNASLARINDELRLQILKLQDEVAMMETQARCDPYRRYL